MKKNVFVTAVLMALFGVSCESNRGEILETAIIQEESVSSKDNNSLPVAQPTEHEDVALTRSDKDMISGNNGFSFDLFRESFLSIEDGNCFMSPLSVSAILGLISNGATGETRENITSTLGFSNNGIEEVNSFYTLSRTLGSWDPTTSWSTANSILIDKPFEVVDSFKKVAASIYDAQCESLDFSDQEVCSTHLNSWVAEKTEGLITSLPVTFSGNTAILTNAVYFKGAWSTRFDPNKTKEETFKGKNMSKVLMMSRSGLYSHYSDELLQAVTMPFGYDSFRMTFILPGKDESLTSLVSKMNSPEWDKLVTGGKTCLVDLGIPRFSTDFECAPKSALTKIGMEMAFGSKANYSEMIKNNATTLSDLLHKARITVDENGAEAAAVTSVMATSGKEEYESARFYADSPFMYIISEASSGLILFIGSYSGVI